MNILETIMAERRADVELAKREVSLEQLEKAAEGRVHHGFAESLEAGSGTRIIAETKKASPSAGLLKEDYRPAEIASAYEQAGAAGISVLTEPHHFMGSEQHLRDVRRAVDLPVLRKDFICDSYQIYEAAAWGADVILLIAAALTPAELTDLYNTAISIGLEVLAEAHNEAELDRALGLEKAVVGVNNRNLKTLKTDIAVSRELAGQIPDDRISISESGIKNRSDIIELGKLGYNGFLIGESVVSDVDPASALRMLLGLSD